MLSTEPIISTAKVRGLLKKNKINYVDQVGTYQPSIHTGIHVWQRVNSVYFEVFGFRDEKTIKENLEKFQIVLSTIGLKAEPLAGMWNVNCYEIVKADREGYIA
jgi:hypothetical protein